MQSGYGRALTGWTVGCATRVSKAFWKPELLDLEGEKLAGITLRYTLSSTGFVPG